MTGEGGGEEELIFCYISHIFIYTALIFQNIARMFIVRYDAASSLWVQLNKFAE